MTSLALHGLVVGVMFLVAYSSSFDPKVQTKPFELVMGEGDNFAATEAAALGTPGGIKLNVPPQPVPEPPKPEVVKVEPAPAPPEPAPVAPPTPEPPKPVPVKETPKPAAPTKSGNTKTKSIAEEMRWKTIVEESKAKQQIAKARAAEKKRLEQERRDQAKREAEAAARAPRIDAEGIAKGVLGGSTSNTKGGAGGTAMTRPDGPALEAYFGMLRERLLRALDKPPGLSDTLVAVAEFRIGADGSISGVKIISSSGSPEFDRAVIEAYSRVSMPPRPDKKGSVESLTFRTKDLAGG